MKIEQNRTFLDPKNAEKLYNCCIVTKDNYVKHVLLLNIKINNCQWKRSKKKAKNSLSYFLNLLYKNEYFSNFQDFFGIFIFVHFFCPFFKKGKNSWKKKKIKKLGKNCDHKNSYGIKQ